MSKNARNHREPTHEEISARAQRLYELEGRPEGRAMQHWLQAETQLKTEVRKSEGQTATPGQGSGGLRGPDWQTTPRQPASRN